jgi:hypothetical protein
MEDLLRVTKGPATYAVLGKRVHAEGVRFFTSPDEELQAGLMAHPAGYEVKAHCHPSRPRTVVGTVEFLYVETGRVRAEVFDEDWAPLADRLLEPGDFVIFLRGGHALTVLEPARIFEVKQGPYPGDAAAKVFR